MSEIGHNAGGERLASFISRIETLESEIADLNGDKSDVFKEAKGEGFDVAAMREVLKRRRKHAKSPGEYDEFVAIVELYEQTLADASSLVRARGE